MDNPRKTMEKEQISTRILHHDRRQGTESGAVHQPIHVSAAFSFARAQDLIDVFQGKPGFTYARQATPSTARLEHLIKDRKSTRLNSSHVAISYAVFCLKQNR